MPVSACYDERRKKRTPKHGPGCLWLGRPCVVLARFHPRTLVGATRLGSSARFVLGPLHNATWLHVRYGPCTVFVGRCP
eukprot:7893365-Alexandrium_andersonii.AAC.1